MEGEYSLYCPQQPANCPYPEPDLFQSAPSYLIPLTFFYYYYSPL